MIKDKSLMRLIVILKRQTITMQEQVRHSELDLLMQFLKDWIVLVVIQHQ
jgi:hypothetical protein